jgi:hypothetical protein
MDPAETAIPEIAIDLPFARKMLARVTPATTPCWRGSGGWWAGFSVEDQARRRPRDVDRRTATLHPPRREYP